jgi:hypothetical protein
MTIAGRFASAVHYMLVIGVAVGAAALLGHWVSWPLLTSALGPTAYVFAAHPSSVTARVRNATGGHAVAIGVGVGSLALFGLLHHPSVAVAGSPSLAQVGAAVLAVCATMLVLEVINLHHAPAAASTLLVATGSARPGKPLEGLVIGLAIVIIVGPLSSKVPWGADQPSPS